jgi:hypothetical protein
MASTSSYSSGSVFTVKPIWQETVRRHEVVTGPLDTPSNEPWFHVAVVQLKDDGIAVDSLQVEAALRTIRAARESSADGAIVVVFIHGWHHNASWKRTASTLATDRDGDDHFHSFRLVLESLALRELERPHWRRVVGVYIAWNGDPVGGLRGVLSHVPWLKHNSFNDRYRVAQRIGAGDGFQDALCKIIRTTKEPLAVPASERSEFEPDSPLIMIGHSMGALMIERGLLALLEHPHKPLVKQPETTNTGHVRLGSIQGPIAFPDLILALNSAADSGIAKSTKEALKRHQLVKTAATPEISFSPPIIMSVTSTSDFDTKVIWRLAQLKSGFSRRTDGNDSALFTHNFALTARRSPCPKQQDVRDFGQNWHCLRRPCPAVAATPAIPVDLPVRERKGVRDDDVPHARYTITPRGDTGRPELMWVFQVPRGVIKNHNDIFNSRARSLILALIQISGAVASLAEDWSQSFEADCRSS